MNKLQEPVLNSTLPQTTSYLHAATSDNTRRAYQSDIQDFIKQGYKLPATPEAVEAYLVAAARTHNPRTLARRLIALRHWHRLQNQNDPTRDPSVVRTLRGIQRLHGSPKQPAIALRLQDLDALIAYLNQLEDLKAIRNKALLLLGYFGAFRRSELVSLTWEHIQFVPEGVIVSLPRSKTDQLGEGQQCVIPVGSEKRCPVRALLAWQQASGHWEGAVFRRFSKSGAILASSITAHHWNKVLKRLAKAVGLAQADAISSHSLRRGFATEAARRGASLPAIQKHGRWQSTKMVVEYIEAGRAFSDSAVKVLFGE